MFTLYAMFFNGVYPLHQTDSMIMLAREAESWFLNWSNQNGFNGFAVVDTATGEVVYMAE